MALQMGFNTHTQSYTFATQEKVIALYTLPPNTSQIAFIFINAQIPLGLSTPGDKDS